MLVLLEGEERMFKQKRIIKITNSGNSKWYNIKGNKVKQIDTMMVGE